MEWNHWWYYSFLSLFKNHSLYNSPIYSTNLSKTKINKNRKIVPILLSPLLQNLIYFPQIVARVRKFQSIDWYSFFLVHSLVTVERFNKFLWVGYLRAGGLPLPIYLLYEFGLNSNGSLAINNLVHFRNDISAFFIFFSLFLFLSLVTNNLSPLLISCSFNFVKCFLVELDGIM